METRNRKTTRTLIPLLAFILAAEGWLVAGSMTRLGWGKSDVPATVRLDARDRVDANPVLAEPEVAAFFEAAVNDAERQWIRSIMQLYLEDYRSSCLAREAQPAGPYLIRPVGPPPPHLEARALARFIRERGLRLFDACRQAGGLTGALVGPGEQSLPVDTIPDRITSEGECPA